MCKQKQLASCPTQFCAQAWWMNSNYPSACVTPDWKGQREQSKEKQEMPRPSSLLVGGHHPGTLRVKLFCIVWLQ